MTRGATAVRAALWAVFAACVALFAIDVRGARAQDAAPVGEFEITVREGVTLLDPGHPVADAFAAYVESGWGTKEAAESALAADGAGRIRVPYRGAGGTVLVWAKGRAPVGLRIGNPLPFDVLLAPAPSPEILVTSSAGTPIGDADVLAEALLPLDRSADVHVFRVVGRSDRAGRVVFPDMPDVQFTVTAHADGFVDGTVFPVDPRRGATVRLGRGSRVAGTLVLSPGGAPAKGATARLGPWMATVGDDGSFSFDHAPPGPWDLRFEGAGFTPPPTRTLVLRDGDDRVGLAVTARRTSAFRAHAVAPEGQVVPAVRARFVYPPQVLPAPREAFATVGIDGMLTIRDLPAAEGVAAVLDAPGCVSVRLSGLSLPAGESSQVVEVKFVAGAALTGVLLDLDGRPVADAVIAAVGAAPPSPAPDTARATSGADGRFSVEGLPPGNAWVRVVGRPIGSETVFGPFAVKASETTDAGELRAFAGWRLDGRTTGAPDGTVVLVSPALLGSGGSPVAGAATLDLARATVVGGTFSIDGLPAGPFVIRAERGGDVVGAARVSLPSAWPVTLACEAAARLRGRLVDGTGRAVVGAVVRAGGIERSGRREIRVDDPSGRFELELPPGRWRIEAGREDGAGGRAVGDAVDVTLPRDAENELTLSLVAGSTIRGVVVGAATGGLVEGATVEVLTVGDERTLATARSDAEGRFTVRGVAPGIVRVRFTAPGRGVFTDVPRVIREADELDLSLVHLPEGVVARVQVYRSGAAPLARAEVRFSGTDGTESAARTDDFGRAVVAGLSPGWAILRVRDEGGATLRTERVFVPDETQEWPLTIDCGFGTRVAGRVTTAARDEPFARVVLRVLRPRTWEVSAVADAQGRYTLPPVASGEGEVEVFVAGATTPWRRPVRVAPAEEQMLDLQLPEQSVLGRVEASANGETVAGAVVELRRPTELEPVAAGVSGDQGVFELRRVPPGVYDLVAWRAGFGPAAVRQVTVLPGRNTFDVRVLLPAEGRVSLRVVDDRGRGVSTAWAVAWRDSRVRTGKERGGSEKGASRDAAPPPPASDPSVTAWARADGSIVIPGLSAGAWRVAVGAAGFGRVDLGAVRVGESVQSLGDVSLPRGATLRVIVQWPRDAGPPPERIAVRLTDIYDTDPRAARRPDDALRGPDPAYACGPGGVVEIPGLAPGVYFLSRADLPASEGRAVVQRVRIRSEAVETVVLDGTGRR